MNRGEAEHNDFAPGRVNYDESLPLQQNLRIPSAPRLMIYNWQTEEYELDEEVDPQPASPSSNPPSSCPSTSIESLFGDFQDPDFSDDVPDVVEGGLLQE
jgi:hypothetical protein